MQKLIVMLSICFLAESAAKGTDFRLDATAGGDSVYFRSTAKLEFIEGKTASIDGYLSCDPGRLDSSMVGILRVDLRTLKTGIDTRDEHMRERHLHTEKYPFAFFELTQVDGLARLESGKSDSGTVRGWFYIHGVKRELYAKMTVRWTSEQGREKVTIRTQFQLLLDEYDIPRPKALFMKLAEKIDVECIFTGYNNLPAADIQLPDWPALE